MFKKSCDLNMVSNYFTCICISHQAVLQPPLYTGHSAEKGRPSLPVASCGRIHTENRDKKNTFGTMNMEKEINTRYPTKMPTQTGKTQKKQSTQGLPCLLM